MTALLIDSGIDSRINLLGLLPKGLRAVVTADMLGDASVAAALRVLATVRDQAWVPFVHAVDDPHEPWAWIDWEPLLDWAATASASVRVRVEAAASLAGHRDARADLLTVARVLDSSNFAALIDALRIAREGLSAMVLAGAA